MLIDDFKSKIAKYCLYQERTHNQVRSKLMSFGLEENEADQYILWLIEEGYLNESRYASAYTRGKFNQNKWGRRKIIHGLKQEEISDYVIKEALAEIEVNYMAQIEKLVQKKWLELGAKMDYTTRNKIYNFMYRKGYESDLILKAIDAL